MDLFWLKMQKEENSENRKQKVRNERKTKRNEMSMGAAIFGK